MTDLKTLLAEADTADLALSPAEARAMRKVVVSAARNRPASAKVWMMSAWMLSAPLAVAALLVAMIGLGATAARRFEARDGARSFRLKAEATGSFRLKAEATGNDQRRQLHFASPGGTRIIWVFNPDLSLKETTP